MLSKDPIAHAAIGIFDSGVGGVTVFQALRDRLPRESLVYLGDTARVPYGTKSAETVFNYSLQNTEFLLEHQVKLVVVACNTASAFAVERLQERFRLPIIGVLIPGAQAALSQTQTKRIGVIGTRGTISSEAYMRAIQSQDPACHVSSQACPLLVPLVEEGWLDGPEAESILSQYLAPLQSAQIDTLILGCTHYPLLRPLIKKVWQGPIQIIDSAQATAEVVAEQLRQENLLNETTGVGQEQFYVTDSVERFLEVGQRFLKRPLSHVEKVVIE